MDFFARVIPCFMCCARLEVSQSMLLLSLKSLNLKVCPFCVVCGVVRRVQTTLVCRSPGNLRKSAIEDVFADQMFQLDVVIAACDLEESEWDLAP